MASYTMTKVEKELHDRVKILAIIRKKQIQEVVEEAIREYIEKNKGEFKNI